MKFNKSIKEVLFKFNQYSKDPLTNLEYGLKSLFLDGGLVIGANKVPMPTTDYYLYELKVKDILTLRIVLGNNSHILSVRFTDGKYWILSESKDTILPELHDWDINDLIQYTNNLGPKLDIPKFIGFSDSSDTTYSIDVKAETCTCSNFRYRCTHHQVGRPERLCKHLRSIYDTYPELQSTKEDPKIDSDGKSRKPRAVFDKYVSEVKNVLLQFPDIVSNFEVCGSYRRNCDMVSDLDFLIIIKPNQSWDMVLDYLESTMGYMPISNIGRGDKKAAYYALDYVHGLIHIDFKAVDLENWPFALLHFTGSKATNIEMRRRANQMGFKLNEYGLFRESDDTPVEGLKTEEDIFKFLELKYKYPWER